MGCVKSTPVIPENELLKQSSGAFSQTQNQSRIMESASWTPGEKVRIPKEGPNDVPCKLPGPNLLPLPANPQDLDLTKMDMPALAKLLSDNRKTNEDVKTATRVPVPFMGPDSESAKSKECKHPKVIVTSPLDSSVKFSVEDPADVVFGVDSFPRGSKELLPDDTIWSGKRELMSNYKYVQLVDKRALKAPDNLRMSKPDHIVNYLTKVAKNDFQKFRVLFRWVAHAITFEVTATGDDGGSTPMEILQSGKADCCGYSKLLEYLCSLAGLTCEVIVGYNKNLMPGRPPLSHAWNRIRLNGRWYLSDSAAATYPSDSPCCPEKFREYEFLAEPNYFNSRRLPAPLDRYGDPVPYISLQQFNIQPTFGAMAYVCDLKVLSHNMGVLRTDEHNRVTITMSSSVPMMTWTSLTASTDFNDHREHAVQWWDGNVLHNVLDIPHNGIWDFKVFGQLVCDRGKERDPTALLPSTIIDTGHCHLVTFTIIAKGGCTNPPRMAPDSGMCGTMVTSEQIRPLTHVSPFVDTEYGKAVVGFITEDYRMKTVYRFFNVDTHFRFISNHVYMERVGDRVIIHIFCPAPGRYILRLLVNTSGKEYSRHAEYLINDTGQKKAYYSMTFSQTMGFNVWGPNEIFAEYGLKVTSGHSSSTITATEGEVQLKLSWPTSKNLVLSCCLQDIQQDDRLQSRRVIIHTVADATKSLSTTTFHIRMKEVGYFVLQVYARPKEATQNKRVGGWLIVVRKSSSKPRFPVEGILCGPNDVFYRLGMRTTASKLTTIDGKGRIDISYDSDIEKPFRIDVTTASHDGYENAVTVTNTVIKQDASYMTSFHFTFVEPNVYAIRLMTVGDVYEWNTIGSWIVIFDPTLRSAPSQKQLAYS